MAVATQLGLSEELRRRTEMGALLHEQLRSLSGVREVRGRGLLQAVEFEDPVAIEFQRACLEHVPQTSVGDYVVVHVGFALQRIDEAEARRVFEFLKGMDQLTELEAPSP